MVKPLTMAVALGYSILGKTKVSAWTAGTGPRQLKTKEIKTINLIKNRGICII
jgi:hypothetical protein